MAFSWTMQLECENGLSVERPFPVSIAYIVLNPVLKDGVDALRWAIKRLKHVQPGGGDHALAPLRSLF